jgi:predicted permease
MRQGLKNMLQATWRDTLIWLRTLARTVPSTIATLLTIALGIGATTAIFAVVQAVLLRPLPYPEPDELVGIWHSGTVQGAPLDFGFSASMYLSYRDENRAFEHFGIWSSNAANVTGIGDPEEVPALSVSAEFLPALGVRPAIGRWFSESDHAPGANETMILTHSYWQVRLGGDPSVLGRTVTVDSRPREVIGVMPQDFLFTQRFLFVSSAPAFLLPHRFDPSALPPHTAFNYQGIARLNPGVTRDQANSDVARLLAVWADTYGVDRELLANARIRPDIHALKSDVIGDVANLLWILMGTVGVVLLIACANVANLLLVKTAGRGHELAIRAALGASKLQIARVLLVESTGLGLLGGVLGVGIAYAGLRLLLTLAPANLPRIEEIALDPVVLVFALVVSLGSGVLLGLAPIAEHMRSRLSMPLRGGRGGAESRERRRSQDLLVVAQIALALVILVGSGLMLRSFQLLIGVEPGFADPARVQLARVAIPTAQAEATEVIELQKEMLRRVAVIPGVESVAFASAMPMETALLATNAVWVEGQEVAGEMPPLRRTKHVSPGLLATQGTPLLAGRDFTWTDVDEQRAVVVVSERVARETWGGPLEALGKRVRFGPTGAWEEVVGVAANVHDEGADRPAAATVYRRAGVYADFGADPGIQRAVTFAIRSERTDTASLVAEVREAVWSVNPNVPLAQVRTLDDVVSQSMARTSFTMIMLGLAGSIALALGLVGIYGVISYSVSRRTREIGIRVAVGARNRDVAAIFLRHAFVLTSAGLGIGLAGAAALSTIMASLLYGVDALDLATYGVVVPLLVAACMLASYLSARRALAVDPAEALRGE